MSRRLICAAAFAVCMAAPGLSLGQPAASSGVEEIVVTGERLREYDPTETPHVALRRRADNLISKLTVVCDTRDQSQRHAELRATLRNLIRAAAQDPRITLGVGEEVVGAFDETMLDQVIQGDPKPDTSRATLIIKTNVTPDDSFDAATGRIRAFVKKTPKVGRSEILLPGAWELTLLNPAQYRPDVARLVAEDAHRIAGLFGDGYGVEVQGLQLPVSWYQSGPLELAIYIPYRLTVRPTGR